MPKATEIVLKRFVDDVTRLYSKDLVSVVLCSMGVPLERKRHKQSRKSPPFRGVTGTRQPVALAGPSPPPPYVQCPTGRFAILTGGNSRLGRTGSTRGSGHPRRRRGSKRKASGLPTRMRLKSECRGLSR